MLNVTKVCGIYTIGAEGKIKINEARGDYFFYPNVTLWGHFFSTCPFDKISPSLVLGGGGLNIFSAIQIIYSLIEMNINEI